MRLLSDIVAVVVAAALSVLIVGVVLLPWFAVGVLDAFVIADVWRWFAVPFLGVKPLSVGGAFGLNCLGWAFVRRPDAASVAKSSESKTPVRDGAKAAGRLLYAILVGWGVAYLTARYWTHTL